MDTKELLKARFNLVRRDLNRVLDRLTDELLQWAPREGMRTVGGQLFEIAGKEIELRNWMKQKGEGEWVEVEEYAGERIQSMAGNRFSKKREKRR